MRRLSLCRTVLYLASTVALWTRGIDGKASLWQSAQQNGSAPTDGGYLGDDSSRDKTPFHPSGVEGATAPSGYSAGESTDDAAGLMIQASSLDEALSLGLPSEAILNCNQERDLLQAAHTHPENFAANHELGVFYFQHGEVAEGIKFLQGAYAIEPFDTNNARWLALAYVRTRQFAPAVDLMQAQIKQSPRDATLVLSLARIHALLSDRSTAITDYLLAASLDRGQENLFAAGIGLVWLGAAVESQRILAEGTSLHPGSAKLWMGLGIAQDLNGRKAESAGSLMRAADLDPRYLPTYIFLAGVSGASAAIDKEILKRLETLAAAHPESAEAPYDYALALSRHAKLDPSDRQTSVVESHLRLSIARDPAFAAAHFELGALYQETGNYAQAGRELELALKLDPGNAAAHYRLASIYRRNNQPASADRELAIFREMHAGSLQDEDTTAAGLRAYAARLSQAPLAGSCH